MKLKSKERKRINGALYDLCKRRHPALPNKDIKDILAPLTTEDGIYCGREGRSSELLYAPDGSECQNSVLIFSWLKGDHDGKYEVNAYVS